MDQEPDAADDENHQGGERVHPELPRNVEAADLPARHLQGGWRDPVEQPVVQLTRFGRQLQQLIERRDGQREGDRHRGAGDDAGGSLAEVPDADDAVDGRADPGGTGMSQSQVRPMQIPTTA